MQQPANAIQCIVNKTRSAFLTATPETAMTTHISLTEANSEPPDLRVEVLMAQDGLKAGSDNRVELLIRILAPENLPGGMEGGMLQIWDGADESPEQFGQDLARARTLAFRDVSLRLALCQGAESEVASDFADRDGVWPLRDLAWGAVEQVAVRLRLSSNVLPEVGQYVQLARIRVQASHAREPLIKQLGTTASLKVVASEEFDSLAIDESLQSYILEMFGD